MMIRRIGKFDRPLCVVRGCDRRVGSVADLALPDTWDASDTFYAIEVVIGVCRMHARELRRRQALMFQARARFAEALNDVRQLTEVVEAAAIEDAETRRTVEALEDELVEAEGSAAFQRERAERAEQALQLVDEDGYDVAEARRLVEQEASERAVEGQSDVAAGAGGRQAPDGGHAA